MFRGPFFSGHGVELNICFLADSDEEKGLKVAHSSMTDLLRYVNDKVREQENWRKTLHIHLQLIKRPTERCSQPELAELAVGYRVYYTIM